MVVMIVNVCGIWDNKRSENDCRQFRIYYSFFRAGHYDATIEGAIIIITARYFARSHKKDFVVHDFLKHDENTKVNGRLDVCVTLTQNGQPLSRMIN